MCQNVTSFHERKTWLNNYVFELMICNFCKKAEEEKNEKNNIHLFNAYMPELTQIARSTVLRMQICFAWKSIWSCSKESRTGLLLFPPPAHAGLTLAVYLFSHGRHFTSSHTQGHAASRGVSDGPTTGYYADLPGCRPPLLLGLSSGRTRRPQLTCPVVWPNNTRLKQGEQPI